MDRRRTTFLSAEAGALELGRVEGQPEMPNHPLDGMAGAQGGHHLNAPFATHALKDVAQKDPVGQVRKIRFHLRHSTASLLLMKGADLAAVQRIIRHLVVHLATWWVK